ncbi:peptide chain release factor 1-like, mitochondrial [Hyperolius riggenbachi]|uniref:peptide chain release factor 1-like, mitochondrial n=1 Tax=Hyperolius riggenbachi TaxID=752182 RepID=UPI0035A2D810
MLLGVVSRCVLCGVRAAPRRVWARHRNAVYSVCGWGAGVPGSRSVADTRLPTVEDLVRSAAWEGYLRRLQEAGSEAAVGLAEGKQEAWTREGTRSQGWKKSHITPLLHNLTSKENELNDLQQLMAADENEDLKALARTEVASCLEEIHQLKYEIARLLIPREEVDDGNLILEVTAGVGGQEAMLFTAEIFDMYQHYASYKRWGFDILEYSRSDLGGVRYASAMVGGMDAYSYLKCEGGVHRVQRVPKTEKQGRIHTSTMTVAILPQPSEIHLVINPKDLRIETKRASGAGGQHVNTTDSAVRIVHIPTGTVAECQQGRSQIKNKETAMTVLRAKLYNMKLEEEANKRQNTRRLQVGSKGRSEKIRTYNFPQDRVTDHRINKTMHNIGGFLLGDDLLDEMIQLLEDYADYESLMEIISD